MDLRAEDKILIKDDKSLDPRFIQMAEAHTIVLNYAMTCEGCATVAQNLLKKLPGVSKVETNVAAGLVTVTGTCSGDLLLTTLKKTGKACSLRDT